MTMITFHGCIDYRSRGVDKPTVARLQHRDYRTNQIVTEYVVIGTAYGYLHTSDGDIRRWLSYSGARKAALKYQAGV